MRSNRDFKRVYRLGRKINGKGIRVYYLKNNLGKTRFGYSVAKKTGKAVRRNLVKRRLREICKNHVHLFQEGLDVVMVAGSEAAEMGFDELEREVLNTMRSGKIFVNKENSGQ